MTSKWFAVMTMNNINSIVDLAVQKGCEVKRNVNLKEITSIRTGGPVNSIIIPKSSAAAAAVLKESQKRRVKVTLLGNGSNVLAPDEGLDGIILRTAGGLNELYLQDEITIFCGSGVALTRLCMFAYENSLTGLEFAYGIPGTAGGAAYMNAGAYGGEMKDIVLFCSHIDNDFNENKLFASELDFSYRSSAYMKNGFTITGISVRLKKGNKTEIKAKMDELMGKRHTKQPLDYPSAGSVFMRPQNNFAGALIERCGLKGYSVGGAQVSEKHAGFIINTGNATTSDVLKLIEFIQKKVWEKTGVSLKTEVKILR